MTGSFSVEWLPGGVLLQTRTGTLTVAQAEQYVAAVKLEVSKAPSPWGAVIDTRGAAAQSEEVQEVIQRLIKFVVANKVDADSRESDAWTFGRLGLGDELVVGADAGLAFGLAGPR